MELLQNILASFIAMWLICSVMSLWYFHHRWHTNPERFSGYFSLLFWSGFWGPFTIATILLQIKRDTERT